MAVDTAGNGWRRFGRVRAGGLVLALAAATLPWGAVTAQAAVSSGALRLTVTKVVAGATGDTLGWNYQAPLYHRVNGTISLDVPAAFTTPQASAPGSDGYVATTSSCARFQVTGIAPHDDGATVSTVITVAVTCAKGLSGAISYNPGTVPAQAGRYVFAATFTPAAGAAAPFTQGDIVTVQHGPLASLVTTPASSTIATGATQTYTVQGLDAFGNSLGNLTGSTKFTITPDGSCGRSVCTADVNGPHTVTATDHGITTTASLTVATPNADLSVTQTVDNATPYYYAPVTFTTTVTNTGTVFWSDGVSATVKEPAALVSPTATPSGSTSYDAGTGTWTIGSLAPGATATLTITGYAGDVSAGTQTVTATVTAATLDPNPANNTAAASEASQRAPRQAVITPDPGNPNPINTCAVPSATVIFHGSAVNAINPAAPPPIPGSYTNSWACNTTSAQGCPAPLNNTLNSPYISYDSDTFQNDATYTIWFTITPGESDPNYLLLNPVATKLTFTTTCFQP